MTRTTARMRAIAKARGLTPREAVLAALCEPTLRDACEALGVSKPTLRDWRRRLELTNEEIEAARLGNA